MPDYFDIHCHILFGVDDGAKTLEDAMLMLQQEYDSGVRTVYLTPHERKDLFACSPELRRKHFELLREAAAHQFPELTLRLGCEVRVHMDILEQLHNDGCLTMGDTDIVLLEFSPTTGKRHILERCHTLINSGYRLIIAHAERCIAIRKDLHFLQTLFDMGVYIQMNAGSIIGEEGLTWKWFCRKAMKRGLLHFIGSDAHDPKQFKPNLDKCSRYLEKTMGADYRDQIMITNPRKILEGSV